MQSRGTNVNVNHTRVEPQHFQDRKDNVVNVAEPRRLELVCVMQPAGPIHGNVAGAAV